MWAPADLFTPTIDALALALKRGMTFATDHILLILLAVALLILALVVVAQVRQRRPRA